MHEKFPFGIDGVVLFKSTTDFLKMNNLTEAVFDLITAEDFTKKVKSEPNCTNEYLRDRLAAYYLNWSKKYPDNVFFKLRRSVIYFQYGDYETGMQCLKIAQQKHPNHYLPKLFLAFEYMQESNVSKVYELFGIKDPEKEITSVKDLFPEVKEMMDSEYLQFLFIVTCIYNYKAAYYNDMNRPQQKEEAIKKVYEFASIMTFIDQKSKITVQIHQYLNSNLNYNL